MPDTDLKLPLFEEEDKDVDNSRRLREIRKSKKKKQSPKVKKQSWDEREKESGKWSANNEKE